MAFTLMTMTIEIQVIDPSKENDESLDNLCNEIDRKGLLDKINTYAMEILSDLPDNVQFYIC